MTCSECPTPSPDLSLALVEEKAEHGGEGGLEVRKGVISGGIPVASGAPPFGAEVLRSLRPILSFLETRHLGPLWEGDSLPVSPASPAGSCLKTSWPGSITVRRMPGE